MNSSLKFLSYSPNTSKSMKNHPPPLAESTVIGSPLGLGRQISGAAKRKSISPIANPSKWRSGVKIDPHVLTDAQSSGIVTRLVKYYDQSTNEADKSRIVYNKFGDFPLVQLKKTEIKRPISRSTSVRIAPPNKSVMNPSLRAAIMRSNSFHMHGGIPKVMPIKMRAKDDSHQIITNHDPIIDTTYSASAKSVLDALEKNCRKRISNEELILDRNKKFCAPNTPLAEVVDSREFIPISQPVTVSTKRNREQISPSKNAFNDSTGYQPSKKFRTRNNALLSSLSSSHFNSISFNTQTSMIQQNSSKTPSIPSSPMIGVKSKALNESVMSDIPEHVNTKMHEMTVVAVDDDDDDDAQKNDSLQPKRLQLFNRKPDPNAMLNRAKLRSTEYDDDEVKIRFVKPKENVLESYDTQTYLEKEKLTRMLHGLSKGFKSPTKDSETKDTVDKGTTSISSSTSQPSASLSFTTSTTSVNLSKPISTPASTQIVVSTSSTPVIKFTEIKENAVPSNESTKTVEETTATISTSVTAQLPKPSIGFQFGTTDLSKNLLNITPAVSTSSTEPISNIAKPISTLALFGSSQPATISSLSAIAAPIDPNKSLISFTPIAKTTVIEPIIKQTLALTASTTNSLSLTPVSATTTAPSSLSTLPTFGSIGGNNNSLGGGFKFGSNSNEPAKTSSGSGFSFGAGSSNNIASMPTFGSIQPVMPKLPVISTQASILSFQTPALTTTTSSTANATSAGFSFGAPSNVSTNVSKSASAAPNPSLMSFGSKTNAMTLNAASATSFLKPETTIASGIGFSFGANNNSVTSNNKSMMTATTSATTGSAFSFGGSSQTQSIGFSLAPTPTASTNPPPPSYAFGGSSTSAVNSGFSGGFSGQKTEAQPSQPQQPAGIFSFTQKPQTAPTLPAAPNANLSSGFNFGSSNTTTALTAQPSSVGFNFGQNANDQQQKQQTGIFSRLGNKPTEAKPFSFGGSANANNNNNPNAATSPFGNSANVQPVFGQSQSNVPATPSSSPMFGQNSNNNNNNNNLFAQNNQTNASSIFSGNSAASQNQSQPQQAGMFSFSGPSTNNTNKTNNNNQSSGMFNFGGSNNSNNNSNNNTNSLAPTSNIFGSATNNNSANNTGQTVSASFTFNPSTGSVGNAQSPPFGQSSVPPSYQFGGSGGSSSIGNNQSASFNFAGAPTPQTTPQATNNAFNFGQTTPSISSGSFNFQGQQQPIQPQASPGGIFNIGTGTSGNQQQQRRPIRAATRRFK